MAYSNFVAERAKDPQEIISQLTPSTTNLLHGAVGLSGEAGELLEAMWIGLGKDKHNVIEEIGDCFFYMELIETELWLDPAFPSAKHVPLSDAAVLVSIHASQVLDIIKKAAVYNQRVNIEKLEGAMWNVKSYLATICKEYEVSREEVLARNVQKLTKRYGSGYSDEAAKKRADKADG